MTEILRTWVLRLTGTAIISSAATALVPEGKTKKSVKFVCGVAAMLALLSIVSDFSYEGFSSYMADYRQKAYEISSEAEEQTKMSERLIIEKQCEAYILDKADELGAYVPEISVRAEWDTNGYWYPVSAELTAEVLPEVKQQLSYIIEADLGIEKDKQVWNDGR